MHIGIDARLAGIAGGHGRYLTQLISHLQIIDETNSYTIFVHEKYKNHTKLTNPLWKKVIVNIPWYGLREQVFLPKYIRKEKIDLMHFPHWNVPIRYKEKFVVTIHDLTLLHHPSKQASTLGPLKYAVKQWGFSKVLRHAVHGSTHIITPSEYVKQDLISTFGVTAKKVTRIYEGAPEPFNCTTVNRLPAQIRKPFLLYVGVAYPHKNLDRLTNAFVAYCNAHPTEKTQLVLAGKHNWFYTNLIKRVRRQYPKFLQDQRIIFTDFVNEDTLDSLYCNAEAVVYPSLSEGFGLPPLEALAHGTPVLTSNTTCLPEILGNSAIFVNPTSESSITNGIATILHDSERKNATLHNGKSTLSRYSWHELAQETLAVYTRQ